MEEAAKAKLPVFVLDRPNPIGGLDVEGRLRTATNSRSSRITRFRLDTV
jgi:uncharacterized protein YbbC (DUF1343 family)